MTAKSRSIFVFITIFMVFQLFSALPPDNLKDRFIKRKPLINKMKNAGIVGEDNRGFLVFRVGQHTEQQGNIVRNENADREIVYQQIADKHGTTLEVVGKRRAVQIANNAFPGHWLQDKDGNWYRKK